jgi:Fe-S cluster assembly protein SufD
MSQTLLINPSAFEAGLEAAYVAREDASEAQRAAFARFAKTGLPNRRVEGWKWSDFNAAVRRIEPANDVAGEAVIAPSPFAALDPVEIQIADGRIILPEGGVPEGLALGVADASSPQSETDDHPIAALNVAMTRTALELKTAKGAHVARPVLIRHINAKPGSVFSQAHVLLAPDSRLSVIETFEGEAAFHSALLHCDVGAGAQLERYVLHNSGAEVVTHGLCRVGLGERARFRQTGLSTGGRLARHETHAACPSPSASIDMASAALVSGERHSDFTSLVRHQGEQCRTRQLHKGVARERGRNVFQGKFLVARGAQKTDARMTANALLLSGDAEANHKPELEIYADDVECAHGSAIGALDEDALFYLRQRGLDETSARALLIEAFVGEVIDGVENEAVREVFANEVAAWLEEQ